MSILEKILI